MAKYDFDKVYDRRVPGDLKYQEIPGVPDVIPMWVADMDFKVLPEIEEALVACAHHAIFGYTDTDETYDQAVVNWYQTRMNWKIDPAHILKMPGVVFAISACIRGLTEPGDTVLVCQPVYHPFFLNVRSNGRKAVVSELQLKGGRYEVDFDDFETKIREQKVKLFLLCSPHNPAGRVWTKEELLRMGEICMRHGVIVVSDEIHSDFVFEGAKHTPFATLSETFADRCITCTAPSKTFNIAGLQAANIIIENKDLREKVKKAGSSTGYHTLNAMAIAAARAAYQHGAEWVDELVSYLQENVKLVEAFAESTNGKISLIHPEGTYLLWLDCRKSGIPEGTLEKFFLQNAHVRLHNGAIFGAGGSGFIRMNIACPQSTLKEALARMRGALKID